MHSRNFIFHKNTYLPSYNNITSSINVDSYFQARETMREIHELQEERLMLSQVKAKTAMEKVHAKSLKKAIKTGNVEQVEQANRQEYQKLAREHDDKVPPISLSLSGTHCC